MTSVSAATDTIMSETGLKNDIDLEFIEWLKRHGATFPKLIWPALNEAGVKGGIARETIETNEVMMNIPIICMMTPETAFADPVVGPILKEHERLLYGDMLLTVYVMHEHLKGDASFYFPFLRTLPTPDTVTMWQDRMLYRLEDDAMVLKVKQKQSFLQRVYARFITHICRLHPEEMPIKKYTYDLFLFAWGVIQSRAFGKRLPWTALVPFADSLNHSNVQTKYDYNVDGNGFFRLFPTGGNRYSAGTEAFNSYGRRPNANLLTDFGFALLLNEWDSVEVLYKLPPSSPGFSAKTLVLRRNRLSEEVFYVYLTALPFKLLAYLRVCNCSEEEAQALLERDTRASTGVAANVTSIISWENEVKTLRHCCALLESILAVVRTPDGSICNSDLDGEDHVSICDKNRENNTEGEKDSQLQQQQQVSTYHFSTTIDEDWALLKQVQQEILRRSRAGAGAETPAAAATDADAEGTATGESVVADLAAPLVSRTTVAVSEMDGQLLVQWQWVYFYRITKKNILVQVLKKIRGLLQFLLQAGGGGGGGCGGGEDAVSNNSSDASNSTDSNVTPSNAPTVMSLSVSGYDNQLVTLVELFAALSDGGAPPEPMAPPSTQTALADGTITSVASTPSSSSSSKTDKFHIADYDSSIGDSHTLLNAYLKSLLEVCEGEREHRSASEGKTFVG